MGTRVRRRRWLGPAVAIGVAALLAACGGTADGPDSEGPDAEASDSPVTSTPPTQVPAPTEPATETPVGLEEADLGNLEWLFRPGGNASETVQVPLVDGAATVDHVGYTMGEPVLSDANGDGLLDALVPLRTLDGNAVDEQWYLWIATEAEPVQVTLPIARTANCGPTTLSVTAVDGGFEVHELRRGLSDIGLACADTGTDERVRTVGALEVGDAGEWWPVQVAPGEGFGGLCPLEANHDAYPSDAALHVAPDPASPTSSGSPAVFTLESWPVYEEDYPGWLLVGVMHERDLGCAWLVPAG